MPLSNSDYDKIFREYEKKQLRSRHELEDRRREVYRSVPSYQALEEETAVLSVEQGKKLISGNAEALCDLRASLREIIEKKAALLKAAGYPPDYLSPRYECPDCRDTGYIDGRKCHCLKQAAIDLLYTQSNLKSVLEKENFDTLSFDYYDPAVKPQMEKIAAECRSFVKDFKTHYQNLFFYGNVGVGKTFLSNCIARDLMDQGFSVIYFTAFQLFEKLSRHTFDRGMQAEEDKYVDEHVFDSDLLILDDLGTETVNSFTTAQLFLILNERHLRKKPTIISTNLPLEQIAGLYSERTFSRISGNYRMFKLTGNDIRLEKRKLNHRK